LEKSGLDVAEDQLVTEAVKGDESALAALLEEAGLQLHADLQHKIGPKYRSLVDADDILQVTCLEAFLRIRSFVPGGAGSFAAWLRRIGENNLLDAIRELERDKRPPPGRRAAAADDASYVALIERVAMTTTTASRVFARDEVRSSVDAALQQLPPDYERALRLYELEGLSGEEVAERMGRSHGAVRMLLARAREALAELLGSPSRFF
jgi:RNA polymerase sigma-70 factor (ECF subfamily)